LDTTETWNCFMSFCRLREGEPTIVGLVGEGRRRNLLR